MDPINYSGMIKPQDFLANVGGGLQIGTAIKQQIAQQQLKQQYQADIAEAMKNPTPEAFSRIVLKYPEMREAAKASWELQSEADRKDQGTAMSQAYSAALAGRNDIVQDLLTDRIQARKNSGLDTAQEENLLKLSKENPDQVKSALGMALSFISDPKEFAKQYSTLGIEQRAAEQAPADLSKKQADARAAVADATTKEVTAKYADSQALADLQKANWDVEALKADIDYKKQSSRIAAMNAQLKREQNNLKRQELKMKIDQAVTERDAKVREKVAEAESGASTIDNMLNTIERIKNNPALRDVVGSLEGSDLYPNTLAAALSPNPLGSTSDDRVDVLALIDTLGSQAFLSQIPNIKGTGALSNAEGEKLQAAFQNFSRRQSEKQFQATLDEATRLLIKARGAIQKKTGLPMSRPDTPAATPSADEIDSLLRKYGAQ